MPKIDKEKKSLHLKNIYDDICHGDIDLFIKIISETLQELLDQEKEHLKLLPPIDKLELLAEWIDSKYPNDPNPEVQEEIRQWVKNIKTIRQRHGLV